MSGTAQAAQAVADEVRANFGEPSEWAAWPGGWPGDIESALVDAGFSARAPYRTARGKGVYPQVVAWQASRPGSNWSVERLRREIADATPAVWAEDRFGNSQHSPSRPETAPGGPTKSAAVLEATERLTDIGVHDHADVAAERATEIHRALRMVPGIGEATANYFLMLVGIPGVKPDTMIHRFLVTVTGQTFSDADATAVITEAARLLDAEPHKLDHAIWKRESDRAAGV